MPMLWPLYKPAPKSGCTEIPAPMKLMIAPEFGSTGAAEMFMFQALSAGDGTKPLRLAPWPRLIPLHVPAWPPACPTCKFVELELALPGFGFMTVIANVPADEAVPVAVNCADDRNVVFSGEPANITCAPLTKLAPWIVR